MALQYDSEGAATTAWPGPRGTARLSNAGSFRLGFQSPGRGEIVSQFPHLAEIRTDLPLQRIQRHFVNNALTVVFSVSVLHWVGNLIFGC